MLRSRFLRGRRACSKQPARGYRSKNCPSHLRRHARAAIVGLRRRRGGGGPRRASRWLRCGCHRRQQLPRTRRQRAGARGQRVRAWRRRRVQLLPAELRQRGGRQARQRSVQPVQPLLDAVQRARQRAHALAHAGQLRRVLRGCALRRRGSQLVQLCAVRVRAARRGSTPRAATAAHRTPGGRWKPIGSAGWPAQPQPERPTAPLSASTAAPALRAACACQRVAGAAAAGTQ